MIGVYRHVNTERSICAPTTGEVNWLRWLRIAQKIETRRNTFEVKLHLSLDLFVH